MRKRERMCVCDKYYFMIINLSFDWIGKMLIIFMIYKSKENNIKLSNKYFFQLNYNHIFTIINLSD